MKIKYQIPRVLLVLCTLCLFAQSASAIYKSGAFHWRGDNGYKVRLDFIFDDDFDRVGHWGYHDVRKTISDFYMTTWSPNGKIVQRANQLAYHYLYFIFHPDTLSLEGGIDVGADPGYWLNSYSENSFSLVKSTIDKGTIIDRGEGYYFTVSEVDKSKFPEYNPKMIPDFSNTAILLFPVLLVVAGLRRKHK